MERGRFNLALNVVTESCEKGDEESGTHQLDAANGLSVDVEHVHDAFDLGLSLIAGEGEAVADHLAAAEFGNTSKAEHGELLVIVVGLDDSANRVNGCLVLVGRTHKVKRVLGCWLSITSGVVNGTAKTNLPATSKIV
jgi:hypothetical protein